MNAPPRTTWEAGVRLTAGEIASVLRAPLQGGTANAAFSSFAIDSRQVRPGGLFFALRGPRHDGHDYVTAALAAGARGIVVSRPDLVPAHAANGGDDVAWVIVADTTRALQDLAASVRGALGPVVGITGSAGKTTAKDMTAAALSARRPTGRTAGNLNNAYGLPLTLLNLPTQSRAAVLEMGMSTPGEIARLVEIADPDVGVILNVREAHLGNFASIEEIALAKGELFRGLRRDATAVWNAADPRVARLAAAFPGRTVSFAAGANGLSADLVAREIEDDILRGVRFRLSAPGLDTDLRLVTFGRHNVENALAALAVCHALGDDLSEALRAVAQVRAPRMRGEVHRLPDGTALVDDTYNANPAAMAAVLASLADTPWPGRKVLVAGDMLELGVAAATFHRQVGEQAARSGVASLVAVGALAGETVSAARALGLSRAEAFADSAEAARAAGRLVAPGDLVVVKGSRGIAMERFVAAMLAAAGLGDEAARREGEA